MKKDKVIPLVNKDKEAQGNFANFVQNIAFNITLSRRMIEMLGAVRDWGFPDNEWRYQHEQYKTIGTTSNGSHNFIGLAHALERRGLIIHQQPNLNERGYRKFDGKKLYKLSKAGELVCELLVEAGLMASVKPKKAQRK